jgi:hypothetical protein
VDGKVHSKFPIYPSFIPSLNGTSRPDGDDEGTLVTSVAVLLGFENKNGIVEANDSSNR